jgi:hypothetical protein
MSTTMSARQRIGLRGEQWAAAQLSGLGYSVHSISDWCADSDLLLESILPVEVKLSRPGKRWAHHNVWRENWLFDVARLPQSVDSLVILICEDGIGERWPYVLPSWELWGRSQVSITSHPNRYKGRLDRYLENWPVVDQVLEQRRRRAGQLVLPLFGQVWA